jgi:low density lipoprotein-related protein 2
LCIDYDADRLYWVDASLDQIETSDFVGGYRSPLQAQVHHPFSLTQVSQVVHIEICASSSLFQYGNWLYVTDWQTNAIERFDKMTGGGHQTLQDKLGGPMDVQMIAQDRQKGKYFVM